MSAVMVGDKNRAVFREANAALADRVWEKLVRAGAVNFSQNEQHRNESNEQKQPEPQAAG